MCSGVCGPWLIAIDQKVGDYSLRLLLLLRGTKFSKSPSRPDETIQEKDGGGGKEYTTALSSKN